jgi:general secretion pathway protein E
LEEIQRRHHLSLLANGLRVAAEGMTSLEEILRVTSEGQTPADGRQ